MDWLEAELLVGVFLIWTALVIFILALMAINRRDEETVAAAVDGSPSFPMGAGPGSV